MESTLRPLTAPVHPGPTAWWDGALHTAADATLVVASLAIAVLLIYLYRRRGVGS